MATDFFVVALLEFNIAEQIEMDDDGREKKKWIVMVFWQVSIMIIDL